MIMVMSKDMKTMVELMGKETHVSEVGGEWIVCVWNGCDEPNTVLATYNTEKEAEEALLLMYAAFERGDRTFSFPTEVIGGRDGHN